MASPRAPRATNRSAPATGIRAVGGILLIVVGLLGLVLPVIPGVPLLLAGVALLGQDHPLVRPALAWLRRRREAWRRVQSEQTASKT
jgi:uncharacterized membrane protein YbaN (DUF454 family)